LKIKKNRLLCLVCYRVLTSSGGGDGDGDDDDGGGGGVITYS